jgi:hypothetical protein
MTVYGTNVELENCVVQGSHGAGLFVADRGKLQLKKRFDLILKNCKFLQCQLISTQCDKGCKVRIEDLGKT